MTKAIGYIRVSTEMQVNEGVSLDAQSAKIRAYCELNDLELVEIICDAGKSAKNTERDGLQKCLSMIASGEAQAIVVYKLDRLSRKVLDTLKSSGKKLRVGLTGTSITLFIDPSINPQINFKFINS